MQSGITFTVFDVLRDIVPFVSGFSPHPLAPIDAVSTTNVVADTAREFENGSYGVRFTPAANPAVNTKAVGSLALRLPLQSLGTGFMVTFKLRVVGMPGGAGTTLRVMSPLQLGPDSNIDQRNSLSLRVTNTPSGGTTNPPGWSIRGFPSVGSSRIQPGDGTAASVGFHEVSFLYQAKQTAVLEDGVLVGVAPIGPIVPPRVSNDPAAAATDWALQASIALEGLVSSGAAATFTADVADIATFPLDGHFDSPTPYVSTSPNELVFNVASAAYLAAAPVAYSIRGRPQRSDPSAAQDALWVAGTDCTVFDAASKNLTYVSTYQPQPPRPFVPPSPAYISTPLTLPLTAPHTAASQDPPTPRQAPCPTAPHSRSTPSGYGARRPDRPSRSNSPEARIWSASRRRGPTAPSRPRGGGWWPTRRRAPRGQIRTWRRGRTRVPPPPPPPPAPLAALALPG